MSNLRKKLSKQAAFDHDEFSKTYDIVKDTNSKLLDELINFKNKFTSEYLSKLDNPGEDFGYIEQHLQSAIDSLYEIDNNFAD